VREKERVSYPNELLALQTNNISSLLMLDIVRKEVITFKLLASGFSELEIILELLGYQIMLGLGNPLAIQFNLTVSPSSYSKFTSAEGVVITAVSEI